MKIPNKLKVAGWTYKVIKNYKFVEDPSNCGQTFHSLLEIGLAGTTPSGKKIPSDRIDEIFIHEVLHCVDCAYNSNNLDEEVVNRLARGLYQVMKDNRMLR